MKRRLRDFARATNCGGRNFVLIMTSDLDIYRAAFDYLERHGGTAPIHAAMEADALLDAGDLDGAATWRRVVKAIREMMEGTRH